MSSSTQDEGRNSSDGDAADTRSTRRPISPNRPTSLPARLLSNLSERTSRRSSTSPLRDEWHFEEGVETKSAEKRQPPWSRTKHPKLGWKAKLSSKKLKSGRVLVVDYVKAELSKEGMRKVASRELQSIHALEKLYDAPDQDDTPILRLLHIQNADWAVKFVLDKFAIEKNEIVGNDFSKYVLESQIENNGRKPVLRGRTWVPQHDPWRGINKMAFGLDYVKLFPRNDSLVSDFKGNKNRFMELNVYDDVDDSPRLGWDVCTQRLSCYIQRQEESSDSSSDPMEGTDIENPYATGRAADQYDNGNTIIVFENCNTKNIEDTLIRARGPVESRWRRLPFYIAADQQEVTTDDELALECMKYITQDLWNSLADSWSEFLDQADHHVAILEEKIYEQPADESRADEIWRNSSNWLKIERLMYTHFGLVRQFNNSLKEYIEDPEEGGWLDSQTETFETLLQRTSENLIKPTDSLSDLMYKSVGIRDTRHSLELSYSMWRLSWITFIFLPLNYSTSFFGMNVDIFQNNPELKWYFISSVPLLVMVFITYWILKHLLVQNRQTPYSRGIYERFFYELSERYPRLWSRIGPRTQIKFMNFWQRLQWHLIQKWNVADKTIANPAGTEDNQYDGLGTWQHWKKVMTRRWTAELNIMSTIKLEPEAQAPYVLSEKYAPPTAVATLDQVICETNINDYNLKPAIPPSQPQTLLAIPNVQNPVTTRGGGSPRTNRFSMLSTSSRERRGSHDSQGSSGVMVEEQNEDWLCYNRRYNKGRSATS